MGDSRKYILNICNKISCGLGSCSNVGQTYNLLNSFVNDNTVFPQLTVDELSKLDNIVYNNRVLNYLDYIDIGSDVEKQILFSGATENDSDCLPLYCKLNPDFLVYKFLNGVRVINVGEANIGCRLEYKAYPINSNENDYSWQSYSTFTDLDANGLYIFKIRDYSPGYDAVICEFEKVISLSLILPSTTTTKGVRTISLNENYQALTSNSCFKKGLFQIVLPLSNGECMKVNYNVIVNGNSSSELASVELKYNCGDGNFAQYTYITNDNNVSPTGSFILCQGQAMCYNLSASALEEGESSNAFLKIDSVDGCNTNNSIVNSNLCETYVSFTKEIKPIYFSLGCSAITWNNLPNLDSGIKSGNLIITPPISNVDEIVNIVLSGNTSISSPINGSMYITVFKSVGGSGYVSLGTCESLTTKPNFNFSFSVASGDSICYNIGGIACANELSSTIRLSSVSSSSTSILPQINTPDRDCFTLTSAKVNVPVWISPIIPYHEFNIGNSLNYYAIETGTIEIGNNIASVPDVSGNLYRRVCISYMATTIKWGFIGNIRNILEIWCSSYNNPTISTKIACHTNISTSTLPSTINSSFTVGSTANNSFTMIYGDKICYKLCSGTYGESSIDILSVIDAGDGRISPYIYSENNILKDNDFLITTTTAETLCQ